MKDRNALALETYGRRPGPSCECTCAYTMFKANVSSNGSK